MKHFLKMLKLFFWERTNLDKNINIFFPNNTFLYIFLLLVITVPLFLFAFINNRINVLLKALIEPKLLAFLVIMFFILYLEISAKHIAIYDGYIIQRTYIIKEEKIKISEIKECRITNGRKKGEALVNLKIIENGKGNCMNINMVSFRKDIIKRITEAIGYQDLIQ